MSLFETILPTSSTQFEKNLEQATCFSQLPIAQLADLVNPWKIDARLLPWLAYRFALEIWQDEWGEEKKRSVIARALELQRIKGTVKGVHDYVNLVDGEVKQIITAPQYFWAGKSLNAKQIEAWHDHLPQIRVYFVNKRMSARGFSFYNRDFAGLMVATACVGHVLYGRQAFLWDNGHAKPLNVISLQLGERSGKAVLSERVCVTGLAARSFFAGSFVNSSFCCAVIKQPQILTWNRDITYKSTIAKFSTTTLTPSLQPLDVRAKRQSEIWHDAHGFGANRLADRFFVMPPVAAQKLYDCLALHDPERAAPKRQGFSFTNVSRLGFAPFIAHILLDMQQTGSQRSFFVGNAIIGRHVAMDHDPKKREAITRAIALSKAARDDIFATFQTSRAARFGDGVPLSGAFKLNSRMDNRL